MVFAGTLHQRNFSLQSKIKAYLISFLHLTNNCNTGYIARKWINFYLLTEQAK